MRRLIGLALALALAATACASGPSPEALARNQTPSTTTTTEPPPEGTFVVETSNGRFAPSNVELPIDTTPIVRWENNDPPREYQIISSPVGIFESPVIKPGESWEFDFSTLDPGIYRYNTFLGRQRIPASSTPVRRADPAAGSPPDQPIIGPWNAPPPP